MIFFSKFCNCLYNFTFKTHLRPELLKKIIKNAYFNSKKLVTSCRLIFNSIYAHNTNYLREVNGKCLQY
jgi:hypothetical protein